MKCFNSRASLKTFESNSELDLHPTIILSNLIVLFVTLLSFLPELP